VPHLRSSFLASIVVRWVAALALVAVLRADQQPPSLVATLPEPALQGRVTDRAGGFPGMTDAAVVLYPADPTSWESPDPKQFQTANIGVAGKFSFAGVLPGEYRIAILGLGEAREWRSPELLRALDTRSFKFRFEGTRQSLDLMLASACCGDGKKIVQATLNGSTTVLVPPWSELPSQLSGTVFDAEGKPAPGVLVHWLRVSEGANIAIAVGMIGSSTTDKNGRYAFKEVSGDPRSVLVAARAEDGDRRRVPESSRQPDGSKLGYVTTFHPSALSYKDAQVVLLGKDTRTQADITLRRQPVEDLRGTIRAQRFPRIITLLKTTIGDVRVGEVRERRIQVAADGSFEVSDLPHGQYLIETTYPFRALVGVSGPVAPITITPPAPSRP
jgi:hypothetical protein